MDNGIVLDQGQADGQVNHLGMGSFIYYVTLRREEGLWSKMFKFSNEICYSEGSKMAICSVP